MPVPYETKPIGGLKVAGGSSGFWPIDLPSRSIIHKILVGQVSGTINTFTVDIFSSEDAAQGRSESDSEGSNKGVIPASLYKVCPTLNSSTGLLEYFSDFNGNGFGYPFFSQEKSPLGNMRRVWLKISPQGSGMKEFAVVIGALTLE